MAARPGLATLPAVQETLLKRSLEPHVASFDFLLQEGLNKAIADLDPVQIDLPDGKGVSRTCSTCAYCFEFVFFDFRTRFCVLLLLK